MRKTSSVNFENQKILEKCGLTYAMTLLEWEVEVKYTLG